MGKEYADIEKLKNIIKGDINEICSNEHLNTLVGMAACKKACDPHVCCWDDDDACYGEAGPEGCDEFEGCKSLKEYADIEKSKQLIKGDINEICSNEHLNT